LGVAEYDEQLWKRFQDKRFFRFVVSVIFGYQIDPAVTQGELNHKRQCIGQIQPLLAQLSKARISRIISSKTKILREMGGNPDLGG
jgi:hypothetical protein